MRRLECHGELAKYDALHPGELRAMLPDELEVDLAFPGDDGRQVDPAIVICTALASLSGRMDEAKTAADLCEAVKYGATLMASGIVSFDEVISEGAEVVGELWDWGVLREREVQAERQRRVELN